MEGQKAATEWCPLSLSFFYFSLSFKHHWPPQVSWGWGRKIRGPVRLSWSPAQRPSDVKEGGCRYLTKLIQRIVLMKETNSCPLCPSKIMRRVEVKTQMMYATKPNLEIIFSFNFSLNCEQNLNIIYGLIQIQNILADIKIHDLG